MSAAAWYADPYGRHELRYFDGSSWTVHVANAGVATLDAPLVQPHFPTTHTQYEHRTTRTFWGSLRQDPRHAAELVALHTQHLVAAQATRSMAAIITDNNLNSTEAQSRVKKLMRKHRRIAWRDGAITGSSWFVGMPGAMASIYCSQFLMMLQIAVLFGRNPSSIERSAEFLVFQERYRDVQSASDALAQVVSNESRNAIALSGAWKSSLEFMRQAPAMIGMRWGRFRSLSPTDKIISIVQLASYVVPFVGMPAWGIADARASRRLAERAHAYYSSCEPNSSDSISNSVWTPPKSRLRALAKASFAAALIATALFGLILKPSHHHPIAELVGVILVEILLVATYGRLLWITRQD
ncbi:MAG TPA: DUF2510 domain-containing protein [Acidimicrobiales bacterium]|nr:DUF2510 domain-containing protein [Acidimicrobiales bacterium]